MKKFNLRKYPVKEDPIRKDDDNRSDLIDDKITQEA